MRCRQGELHIEPASRHVCPTGLLAAWERSQETKNELCITRRLPNVVQHGAVYSWLAWVKANQCIVPSI